ncbi:hypothetical protein [Desulfosporosinus lacus]|uniref:Uncharacterized protein n=1 Tax=Desulfosporosinus lacus DSM 15449 TaxID=1121420 RepID=A0A1M5WEX0_9FIRM|nr:hypothetical protein [Desulfosporosinus lacus]SHH86010.1 hypothetical protein SAMN02746098_01586 [Desulfosporosinus lacus DSM 15449]
MRTANDLIMHDLYTKAFTNTLHAYMANEQQDVKPFIKKMIVYGVKAVNTKKDRETITQEDAERDFQYVETIKLFMGSLTPAEFVNLFPIRKDYRGHKYECKDYFYTRDYIKGLNPVNPIGDEMTMFLWEYTNWEINMFTVHIMGCMSNLRRLAGQSSLMEEWIGIMEGKTYTMHTDLKGTQFLFDKETGKTTKVNKRRSKHLKLVR